jgi:hypothetical protein
MKLRLTQRFRRFIKTYTRLAPSFIIIGAQRAGTTSLYTYLSEHPDIVPARQKEIHFFDRNYQRGIDWYRHQFRTAPRAVWSSRPITGESTPYYLFHPLVAQRIQQSFPAIKLIVLLRNPVDRAFSHYHHSIQLGAETLLFEEAIAREPERLAGERERLIREPYYVSEPHIRYSYQARGVYVDQIASWLDVFPREQMLILKSEDLYADPPAVLQEVCSFLGLPFYRSARYQKYNQLDYSVMFPAIRITLLEYFAPHNERLYRLLGRDFGWDY